VRDAQRGRPSALKALLERLRPWFLRLFARRVDRDGAQDLTQAALIRVWQALPQVDPDRAAQYLLTIAMNLVRTARADLARDARRHVALEVAYPMTPPVNPDRDVEYRDLARIVHDVSRTTLTPELHEVIVELLRGLRPSEIAADRNINDVTVRTRLRRARRRLGPQVRDYLVREKAQADRVYRADPAPHARAGARERATGLAKTAQARASISVQADAETGAFHIEILGISLSGLELSITLTPPSPTPISGPVVPTRFSRARTLSPNPK
jgi:RNA polymerase sigma factor (sigma-70 family)